VYYLLAGVQVAMALGFLVAAVAMRRHRAAAAVAGAAERVLGDRALCVRLRGGGGATLPLPGGGADGIAHRFLAWNTPIHFLHAGMLTVALLALLWVPLLSRRRAPDRMLILLAVAALSGCTGRPDGTMAQQTAASEVAKPAAASAEDRAG
jgi:hypothetical protein